MRGENRFFEKKNWASAPGGVSKKYIFSACPYLYQYLPSQHALNESLKCFWIERMPICALQRNFFSADKLRERTIQIYHAMFGTRLNNSLNLMSSPFPDKIRGS